VGQARLRARRPLRGHPGDPPVPGTVHREPV